MIEIIILVAACSAFAFLAAGIEAAFQRRAKIRRARGE